MTCVIGLDLGTSAVKALLIDERQAVLAEAEVKLATQHPAPLASEQDVEGWWEATVAALDQLSREAPAAMARVRAIGLAGQMHAAVLLDVADRPVRPAMLWNDSRAHAEADALKRLGLDLARKLGVPAMAGMTAPKLAWLARHEPAAMARTRHILLTKDFVRLHLTGERVTDVSDAAGTWLLDQARRSWSPRAIAATGLDPAWLPPIVEGSAVTGTLRPELAARWGCRPGVVVAGGGGDTPAGGVGIGAVEDGQAYVSLGTSAQMFVAADAHRPAPEQLVHAFCHAVPGRWYQMAAMQNGAGVLSFVAGLLGVTDITGLVAQVEAGFTGPSRLLVLPYLNGERTPHDDPHARGVVMGLTSDTSRTDLAQAAMEGVAFAFADARDALAAAGVRVAAAGFIGGGARSRLWGRMIASVLGIPLQIYAGGERGPAFGAARLGWLALGRAPADILVTPAIKETLLPDADLTERYAGRVAAFRRLYVALRPEFAP